MTSPIYLPEDVRGRRFDPIPEGAQVTVANPRVHVEVDPPLDSAVPRDKGRVDPGQSVLVHPFDLVVLQIEEAQVLDAFEAEVDAGQLVIAEVHI